MKTEERIQQLITDWTTNPRWKGIERPYTAEKSNRTTRFISTEYSIARRGAEILGTN